MCICVTLQQGQVQVLSRRLGHESGEGHERSITSTGLTNQTAAQERNGLCGTLVRERREIWGEKGKREREEYYLSVKRDKFRARTPSPRYPSPSQPPRLCLHLLLPNYCTIVQCHQLTVRQVLSSFPFVVYHNIWKQWVKRGEKTTVTNWFY